MGREICQISHHVTESHGDNDDYEPAEKKMVQAQCSCAHTLAEYKSIGLDRYSIGLEQMMKLVSAWEDVQKIEIRYAKCEILSVIEGDEYVTAFLLSESSLLVYDTRVVLKTCGKTVPFLCLPVLLDIVLGQDWSSLNVDDWLDAFVYIRGDYIVPMVPQSFLHKNFDSELRYLEEMFPKSDHCVMGSKSQARLNIFSCVGNLEPTSPFGGCFGNHSLTMTEFVCMELSQERAALFQPLHQAEARKSLLPLWDAFCSGKPYTLDDHFFSPCGYSANLVCDGGYVVVHITPQASCSYVSVETNMLMSDDDVLLKCYDALSIFDAREIRLSRFQPPDEITPFNLSQSRFTCMQNVEYTGPNFSSAFQLLIRADRTAVALAPTPFRRSSVMTAMGEEDNQDDSHSLVERTIKRLRVESIPSGKGENLTHLKSVAEHAIASLKSPDHALMLVDVQAVVKQFDRWRRLLPRIIPHYAVKCNPDPVLLRTLVALGAGFDCATSSEISTMLQLGVHPDQIVYANPCKQTAQILHAASRRVKQVVFDNHAELDKMKESFPDADLLLRIATNDEGAQCPMSMKYGAALKICKSLLTKAMDLGLNVVGVSFHVGSGCSQPNAFKSAIVDARKVFDMGKQLGFEMKLLDIGGGFPGSGEGFDAMAKEIREATEELFPPHVRIIAEPGRYFAEPSHALLTKVVSMARVTNDQNVEMFRYYLNDGLYGSFNCILFDHATVSPILLRPDKTKTIHRSSLFGPTCDGYDQIMEMEIQELGVGDYLLWENMGAYTTAAATSFNGFRGAEAYYYRSVNKA